MKEEPKVYIGLLGIPASILLGYISFNYREHCVDPYLSIFVVFWVCGLFMLIGITCLFWILGITKTDEDKTIQKNLYDW